MDKIKNTEGFAQVSWESFSELLEVQGLIDSGIENVSMAFHIENEKDIEDEEILAQISWIKFNSPEYDKVVDVLPSIEGKLYRPKEGMKDNGEIIVFTPGFPGGNAGRFEQRYAKHFVDAGYSFFTVRHNGTSLINGETSAEILNSEKRMDIAKKVGEHHIGGTREEGYRPDEMIYEPITAVLSLQKKYKRIHMIGQSMGVASSYNSVTVLGKDEEISSKFGNIVGIAGYIGKENGIPDGVWNGMKDFKGKGKYPDGIDGIIAYELDYVKSVDLNFKLNSEEFKKSLLEVGIKNSGMKVPDHVGNVLIYTPEDPLVAGPESDDESVLDYGPRSNRKLIIKDETGLGEKKPHSMLWIEPENLIRAVQAKISEQGPHFVQIPNTSGKMIKKA